MNYPERQFALLWAVLVCLCGLGPWRIGLGQDLSTIREGATLGISSPSGYASNLLGYFELVADGEFYALPESTPEELRALKPEEVVVKFRIHTLYKGPAADSIDIRMHMDMLAFPGEGISRYAKRQQIIAKQDQDLEPVWQQYKALESSYKAGEIDESEFWAEAAKHMKFMREREERDGLSGGRRDYLVMDAMTFYDKGGVIRAGENYLIGVNPFQKGAKVYLLTEFSGSSICWGEMREHILPGFDQLRRSPPGY